MKAKLKNEIKDILLVIMFSFIITLGVIMLSSDSPDYQLRLRYNDHYVIDGHYCLLKYGNYNTDKTITIIFNCD